MVRGVSLVRALPYRLAVISVAAALVFGAAFSRPAAALQAGASGAAAATQDGWWNRLQGPQEGEPEGNPLRPALPAVPNPPTVPGDAIVTEAGAGQLTALAAVGIEVALPPGGMVDALTLRMKEHAATGANVNSNTAKVLACPATTPFGPAKNAAWRDRPQADCGLVQVEGVRAEDGSWTFDLTSFGTQWTDPFASLAQHGVVLAVDPTVSPGPTKVSWLDFDTGNVIVELVASVVPESSSLFPGSESQPPASEFLFAPEPAPAETFGTAFSDPLAFPSGEPFLAPEFSSSPVPVTGGEPTPESPATLAAAPQSQAPARPLRVRPAVGFWDNVPTPTALLLPVALGLALLVGLAMGPGGRPLPVWRRAGGLSRALARRNAGGGDIVV